MSAVLTYNLPMLAGAPNGIKKLRELILELAVRGKLVPQDADDEPASELLKRIAVEKEKLSPKVKKTSAISVRARAFELPESWRWASFGDIAQHNSGKTLDKGRNSGVPRDYITTSNLYWGKFELSGVRQMLIEEKDLARCTAIMSDLLICEGGEAGRAAVWDQEREICFQNHVHRARFFCGINPHYVQRCFERLNYSGEIAEYRKGVGISNMSSKSLASIPVPLPPITEQHRIVAKVDELMALCDRLEARQADSDSAHAQLVQALLGSLTQASDAEDFAQSWQRLVEHFHALLTTESSIDALKQTLLQLAVMGKLVPQDPSDEPACKLLGRISTGKAELVRAGILKAPKPLPSIKQDEIPYTLPLSWQWVRLGEISEFINGDRGKNYPNRSEYVLEGIPWINTGHIEPDGTLSQDSMNFITRDKFESLNGGKIRIGDLVYCLRGATFGKTAIVDPFSEGAIASSLMIIRPFEPCSNRYMYRYLISQIGRDQIFRFDNGSAQPNLSANNVRLYVYPLPPLAEQHRIVSKLDQLMALCDRLKARLSQARQVHEHLASALVEQAVA
ncbi:TPA: restriction endonuclease subunit S [Pseudomonas putida]|uniref:restriction endonuclease subunit S n=1 Tax=Pseudomonas putida TaxID=303 RepID=UPI000281E3D1|nr:restriction endonuclease subunit S [Pseudomonas putida]EMR48528.1 type I restriction-modification system subunit S [Pseudomonas putida LS46]HEE9763821.1 restriction endonuclease subunit S [Pseudomonas putida]